jgi:hypothetical protein
LRLFGIAPLRDSRLATGRASRHDERNAAAAAEERCCESEFRHAGCISLRIAGAAADGATGGVELRAFSCEVNARDALPERTSSFTIAGRVAPEGEEP